LAIAIQNPESEEPLPFRSKRGKEGEGEIPISVPAKKRAICLPVRLSIAKEEMPAMTPAKPKGNGSTLVGTEKKRKGKRDRDRSGMTTVEKKGGGNSHVEKGSQWKNDGASHYADGV